MLLLYVFAERIVRFSNASVTEMFVKSVSDWSRALTHMGYCLLLGLANGACYLTERIFCIALILETVDACMALFVSRGARGFH